MKVVVGLAEGEGKMGEGEGCEEEETGGGVVGGDTGMAGRTCAEEWSENRGR